MGNQQTTSTQQASTPLGGSEPLESFSKEKERDDHLKNLGFKRSRSLRKSIAKRLKKKKKSEDVPDGPVEGPTPDSKPIDQDPKQEAVDKCNITDKPLVGQPQPLPFYVQDLEEVEGAKTGKMDRIRRSFRSSLRRKKDRSLPLDAGPPNDSIKNNEFSADNAKPPLWQQDEVAVRSGICNFQVKYLGCVEVFSSRGMEVCEEAVKVLKNSKRKSVRSVLYVSGDGLRVVDDETRGLILDQTIEKVSFCAPDRNYDRGFSYICRDGTTRRWMCHGFMAVKDSGERLSHAVGCAFAICLERKQKRDTECSVSLSFDSKNTTFTRVGSFRQASLTERLQDPQGIKPSQPPPMQNKIENPYAIARPHATDLMLQRQTSFRGFSHLQASGNSPFKRQLSLRLSELPSTLERQRMSGFQVEAKPELSLPHPLEDVPEEENEIDKMCQKVSAGLAILTAESSSKALKVQDHGIYLPGRSVAASSPLQPVPEHNEMPVSTHVNSHSFGNAEPKSMTTTMTTTTSASANATKLLELNNPWDWVPDQPSSTMFKQPSNNCDSVSSGLSSGSMASLTGAKRTTTTADSDISLSFDDKLVNGTDDFWTTTAVKENSKDLTSGILDDPFDAEWAALAMRNCVNQKNNPFFSTAKTENSVQKAFELQM